MVHNRQSALAVGERTSGDGEFEGKRQSGYLFDTALQPPRRTQCPVLQSSIGWESANNFVKRSTLRTITAEASPAASRESISAPDGRSTSALPLVARAGCGFARLFHCGYRQ